MEVKEEGRRIGTSGRNICRTIVEDTVGMDHRISVWNNNPSICDLWYDDNVVQVSVRNTLFRRSLNGVHHRSNPYGRAIEVVSFEVVEVVISSGIVPNFVLDALDAYQHHDISPSIWANQDIEVNPIVIHVDLSILVDRRRTKDLLDRISFVQDVAV